MKLNGPMRLIPALVLGAVFATTAHAERNGPCNPGNAVFCGQTGPAGPQGPQGEPGPAGPAGQDGVTSLRIIEVPSPELQRLRETTRVYVPATCAIASLQTRTPEAGQWTGALGVSGTDYGVDGVSAGVRYGLTDRADVYAVIGGSRYGGTVWGAGVTFVIGGAK